MVAMKFTEPITINGMDNCKNGFQCKELGKKAPTSESVSADKNPSAKLGYKSFVK